MVSSMQTIYRFLICLVSRYTWISTLRHSPALKELVFSDAIPTDLQAAQPEACIKDLDAPITQIQRIINLLRLATASLEEKMERLKDVQRDYRAVLSPMRRLPPEVLVEILRWTPKEQTQVANPGPAHVFGFNVFKIGAGPWHLGQVCRSWRKAVQTLCPEIWSPLKIAYPRKRSEDGASMILSPKKDIVALLDRALERGGNRRLDVYFRCLGFDYEDSGRVVVEEPEELNECFDLLLKLSQRWGTVELALVPSLLPRLSSVRGRVDKFEDVYLKCLPNAMEGTVSAFEFAPKLKTLDLFGMHDIAGISFPKKNLVVFSDGTPIPALGAVPEYLKIIASAPNLLAFSHYHYSNTVPASLGPSHPQVVHQSLQTLSTSLGAFIDSLVLPNVTRMTLASVKFNSRDDAIMCPRDALSHVHSLIICSRCSLTTLIFVDAIMDENLLRVLQLSLQLTSLCFKCKQTSRESVATMKSLFLDMAETIHVGGALQHTLLPCLKVLEFMIYHVNFDSVHYLDVKFVDMIASRRGPVVTQRLETLRVAVEGRTFFLPFDTLGVERLERMRDDGLDFELDLDDWDERFLLANMRASHSEDD